jgi:hypothetical protein
MEVRGASDAPATQTAGGPWRRERVLQCDTHDRYPYLYE